MSQKPGWQQRVFSLLVWFKGFRYVKFGLVGASGTVVNLLVLYGAHEYLFRAIEAPGSKPYASLALAIAVSTINNFTWNRLWTFPESRQRRLGKQLGQFALVNVIGLTINTALLLGLDKLLSGFIAEPWSYNLAKAFAIGVVLFWNFFVNRLWTYKGIQ